MKWMPALLAGCLCAGCGMSEEEVREKAGDAAVSAKRAAERTEAALKEGYEAAAEKGKELAKKAGETWSDAVLRSKVLAGFRLINGLDHDGVTVEAHDGVVHLSGSVPTQLDKTQAEGVAFGITGDVNKLRSTLRVVAE